MAAVLSTVDRVKIGTTSLVLTLRSLIQKRYRSRI